MHTISKTSSHRPVASRKLGSTNRGCGEAFFFGGQAARYSPL